MSKEYRKEAKKSALKKKIQDKTAHLIEKEGKKPDQAYAISISMSKPKKETA